LPALTHPLYYWRQKNRYYHEDLERLHRFFVPAGLRILEIGSGTGSLLNALQPSFGVGIDRDADIVAQAQAEFPHLHFRVQDAHTLGQRGSRLGGAF
jgi:SAM-dependent methyltransferase